MINPSTNAASAEVTVVDVHARWPLLFLLGSGLAWLVLSGVFALIAALQLHTPSFLADCPWLTHGHAQALRETAFIYGWCANAGLAVALWVLGRLGGYALRALNWVIVGTIFWNLGVTGGLIGIAAGDLTSFPFLQLPRYVQPLLVVAYGAIAIAGVLAWNGRRTDSTFAAQWYAAAALFLFPWLLCAAQVVLLWLPVRGTVQAVAAGWFTQSAFTLWLAPLALAGAYYVVPKVSGRVMPSYDFAPLGFWTLIFVGSWTGGRHLVGGPVPAWIPTIAVVACCLVLFHHLVLFLNLRTGIGARGTALGFIRFGIIAYIIVALVDAIVSFRGVAERTQFTLISTAIEQLGLYGGISMMLFGTIYYMLPRLTGNAWASGGLIAGHRVLTKAGVLLLVITLVVAGWRQGAALLDPKVPFNAILDGLRTPLLVTVVAQGVLLLASLLLFVNFVRSACTRRAAEPATIFRQPSTLEAHV
jgi:cytochrome c oxidase cbb3-type subunit I